MTEAYREIEESGVPYPKHVSQKVRKIIDWCLHLNPKKRPNCSRLLEELNADNLEISIFRPLNFTNNNILTERKIERNISVSQGIEKLD